VPRYCYRCLECEEVSNITHGMFEEPVECPCCQAPTTALVKVIGKINIKKNTPTSSSAASRVKEFIEDSREVLEQQKAESKVNHD